MAQQLLRSEMLELVTRIYRAKGTGKAAAADIALFRANCVHPSGIDIMFWPELVPELAGRVPTVEEVVELAMKGME